MTPAEATNLRALIGVRVRVRWMRRIGDDLWPHFQLDAINVRKSMVKLRGMDYPASEGGHKHAGDVTWYDWSDIDLITPEHT